MNNLSYIARLLHTANKNEHFHHPSRNTFFLSHYFPFTARLIGVVRGVTKKVWFTIHGRWGQLMKDKQSSSLAYTAGKSCFAAYKQISVYYGSTSSVNPMFFYFITGTKRRKTLNGTENLAWVYTYLNKLIGFVKWKFKRFYILSFYFDRFSTFVVLIQMLHHDLAKKNVILLMMDIFSNKLKYYWTHPLNRCCCACTSHP